MEHFDELFYSRYQRHLQTVETLQANKKMIHLEEKLINCIENAQQEAAEEILNDILYRFVSVPYDNLIRTVQLYLTGFVSFIVRSQAIPNGIDVSLFATSTALISMIDDCKETADFIRLGPWLIDQLIQLHKSLSSLSSANPYINRALQYIEEHIYEQLTLDKIAAVVGITPTYLSHLFKEEMTVTMNNHINKRKISCSARDLAHTNLSLREISQRYHFSNQSHFSLLFKKFKGMTPLDYRKIYQQSAPPEKV
ncbi:helix-turn-helix transcriptional regulator [Salisediminibacterium halotolerans]|uniref:helix-turn-helix transcriptional regulator n=1 Tax=Salisediminibacterium halotolerans TaxID=517425 RepID=UPI000EAC7EC4|nr:AraC family transcriptional regulator [Salisediminibacterium halotolerans]RLJ74387.1 AraC family transcriptional regulator [Actinophytocola xinjiangensis]RPE87520.1 AraC family transcriptional regulator [Salisediminibacterium halotolerans]TWG35224.1 AraC family transcriptional regulator [Salisediminibacterium halotolerans]GEL08145.1 hypothetical protein SHA02_15610 [Salisediminibacterium halotolerans]